MVLDAFDIRLKHTELNCCGYPIRQQSLAASVLAAARNLAIAQRERLPLLTPCQCCYGNLRQAAYWLAENAELRDFVGRELAAEGLCWRPGVPVRHLLSVLAEDIGIDRIRGRVTRPLPGLPAAAHYGCHALRPGHVMQLDNPLAPTLFENIIAATGAEPVDWPLRLDCCGHPVRDKNPALSRTLMDAKREDARTAGARILVTACTYCQMQFANIRETPGSTDPRPDDVPAVLISQLLGWAMDLPADGLGAEIRHLGSPS
jgi:heterodisulfide reductase subunit B